SRHGMDPNVVDLHELTVKEAIDHVEVAVNEWYSREGATRRPSKPLKIIAGAGTHSSDGIRKLYPAVSGYLQKKGWKIEPGGNGWFFRSVVGGDEKVPPVATTGADNSLFEVLKGLALGLLVGKDEELGKGEMPDQPMITAPSSP
ncbi:hypothetical protein BDK51DRAFT_28285, partial [Blyttiomyces helicus]